MYRALKLVGLRLDLSDSYSEFIYNFLPFILLLFIVLMSKLK